MSTPEQKTDTPPATFEDKVKDTLTKVTTGEDGKNVWPEDTDESVLYAAKAEKRYRDTQSSYTKGQQALKAKEEETKLLRETIEKSTQTVIPADQQAKMDELKHQDPDAWRKHMNQFEADSKKQVTENLNEISEKANKSSELIAREHTLTEFIEANPGFQLTDEMIENDIPPRITKKLAEGTISFGDFLGECKDFLAREKTTSPTATEEKGQPNLSEVGGGDTATDDATKAMAASDYNSEIY